MMKRPFILFPFSTLFAACINSCCSDIWFDITTLHLYVESQYIQGVCVNGNTERSASTGGCESDSRLDYLYSVHRPFSTNENIGRITDSD